MLSDQDFEGATVVQNLPIVTKESISGPKVVSKLSKSSTKVVFDMKVRSRSSEGVAGMTKDLEGAT